jgi:hypothetical protein
MFDRLIDPRLGKFNQQDRRSWREAVAHDRGGHADRTEIVRLVVRWVVPILIAISAHNGGNQHAGTLGRVSGEAVHVTEGKRQVDDERRERKP